ncbi:MAG: hypothetical protein SXQ77_03495 [Halobacteria archaeon]|nr:hypothetical protein [Halobacteria archaeon]
MSLSLSEFNELLHRERKDSENLGDRLSGSLDVDVDSVEDVRDIRETI